MSKLCLSPQKIYFSTSVSVNKWLYVVVCELCIFNLCVFHVRSVHVQAVKTHFPPGMIKTIYLASVTIGSAGKSIAIFHTTSFYLS